MNQPVSMSCGHSACKACLQDMFAKQLSSASKSCPLCRARIDGKNLNTNVTVRSLIGRIDVRCTNRDCQWVGKHDQKEQHKDTCPYMILQCPNGCVEGLQRSALDQHLETCPYKPVPCRYCNVGIASFQLQGHLDNCPEGPLFCPLQC